MKHYCVEVEDSLAELVEKVNSMIAIGYMPVGGIQVRTVEVEDRKGYSEYSTTFYQALFIDK